MDPGFRVQGFLGFQGCLGLQVDGIVGLHACKGGDDCAFLIGVRHAG